jgi:hypothetical protein
MSRTGLVFTLVAGALLASLVHAPLAFAHGPCGSCLSIFQGPPDTQVTVVQTTAVEVRWNPPPPLLVLGGPDLGRSYVPTEPSFILAARGERRRGLTFEVPDVAPGKYLVVIYDGSEGRQHFTWDYFRVTAGPPARTEPIAGGGTVLVPVLWALLGAAVGAGGVSMLRHRRRGQEPR